MNLLNISVMKMEIKRLTTAHTSSVFTVLSDAFSNPWSAETVFSLLNSKNAVCFGVFDGETLVGYAALEWVLDEGSLTDIAVLKDYRRKGIATLLMNRLMDEAKSQNLQFVTLEVRHSNIPAIKLYESYGFEQVGKRPSYYRDPVEDAILMTKTEK